MHILTRNAGANIMGWTTYPNKNKKAVISEIKSMYPSDMEWSLVGNNLWGLFVSTSEVGNFKVGDKIIVLFRLQSFGKNEFGYKLMDEGMYPYYYDCPLKFLKMSVVCCAEWRADVTKYHSDKRSVRTLVANIKIGDIIKLKGCKVSEVKVVSVNPLRAIAENSTVIYRIPNSYIAN